MAPHEPSRHFNDRQRIERRRVDRAGIGAAWRSAFDNPHDAQGAIEPDDVERRANVLHPETVASGDIEHEQHSLIVGERAAKHEAPGAPLVRFGNLDANARAVAEDHVSWVLRSEVWGLHDRAMTIKSSTAREVDRLAAQLRDGSPVEREAAIARLRVIGARAIDRLARLIRSSSPPAAHAAALKALEGVDDPRARDIAIESLSAGTPAVAAAAIGTLRPRLASDAVALDAVTAVALDKSRPATVRLAALDALSDLPRQTIQPVLQQVGGDDPALAARAAGDSLPAPLDHPAGIRDWLTVRGEAAPLSEIHDAIVRIREREREEASARRRQEWQLARGAAHLALAKRESRVALYDLRETFDAAQGALPLDFLAAAQLIGDASCVEPLARAWSAGRQEPWWRDHVAQTVHAIAARAKLTGRHAITRRVRVKYPGLL